MDTKEKILKSALRLFASKGIDKTSTAQITKDVGVASGTLFVHFKTKQDLIDTLYLRIKRDSMGELARYVNSDISAEKNFRTVIRKLIEYFILNYDAFIFIELVENDPQISQTAMVEAQKSYGNITQISNEWIQIGKFKNLELELIQRVTWSLCKVIIRYCVTNKIQPLPEKYIDLIWEALKK